MATERDDQLLRRMRMLRVALPVAVVFFGLQAAVQFADGSTAAGIALSVCAGSSAIAGLMFFLMRNATTAPSWSAPSVQANADGATVHVRRISVPTRDRLRAYEVRVDESVVGAVRDGDEIGCGVPAGTHVIRIKLDWSGSRPVGFEVASGDSASFVCQPSGGAASAILDLLLRRPWIDLREVSAE